MRPSWWAAVVVGALALGGCQAPRPDTAQVDYVDVPMNEPTELSLPRPGSTLWAESDRAADVTCFTVDASGAGREEMDGHFTQYTDSRPVRRDGEEFRLVGKLATGPGDVTVECAGPGGTDLYAAVLQPPS